MSVLVCSFVLISNPRLLMRLNVSSITASFFFSASRARLYNRCSLHSFSHHPLLHYEEYPLLYCVSLTSIHKAVYLGSESHKLCDAMSIVSFLENGSRQLLVEVEEGWERRKIVLVNFLFVIFTSCPRSNSCYPVLRNRMTCTSHTSYERCYSSMGLTGTTRSPNSPLRPHLWPRPFRKSPLRPHLTSSFSKVTPQTPSSKKKCARSPKVTPQTPSTALELFAFHKKFPFLFNLMREYLGRHCRSLSSWPPF